MPNSLQYIFFHSFRIYTNPQLYHCNHGQKIPPTSVGGIFSFL
ncbi:hypothetical protein HMPREF1546_04308 [Oscillibacter sp. KLE 1745]|nr:hypothetical protein HMPREF1546_04308 [Oscillibacter sp. KLE 1745]